MIKRFVDIVLGYFMRILLHGGHEQSSPLFDLNDAFDKLNLLKDGLMEQIQKVMLTVFAFAAATSIAIGVLVVRIYQLSSGNMLGIGSFQIDGAIVFGLILAAAAGGLGYSLFGRKPQVSIEDKIREARAKWDREKYEHQQQQHTQGSPLEATLAMLIQQFMDSRSQNASAQPQAQRPSQGDQSPFSESYTPETAWKSDEQKIPQA